MAYVIIALVVVLVAAGAGVVLYIKRGAADSAALKQTDAALDKEEQRVTQMETAAAAARAERAKEFDAKAAAVRTAADAVELLHEASGHRPDPAPVPDPRPAPGA